MEEGHRPKNLQLEIVIASCFCGKYSIFLAKRKVWTRRFVEKVIDARMSNYWRWSSVDYESSLHNRQPLTRRNEQQELPTPLVSGSSQVNQIRRTNLTQSNMLEKNIASMTNCFSDKRRLKEDRAGKKPLKNLFAFIFVIAVKALFWKSTIVKEIKGFGPPNGNRNFPLHLF